MNTILEFSKFLYDMMYSYNEKFLSLFNRVTDLENKALSIANIATLLLYPKVEKYTNETNLPALGKLNVVYFLNVAGVKYLKYWDGTTYKNASDRIDTPKYLRYLSGDYYAQYSDINFTVYNGYDTNIIVIEDENNSFARGKYFYDGINVNEEILL